MTCDDGNERNNDACRNTCRIATCGDGVRRTDIDEVKGYEACDDANESTDWCVMRVGTPATWIPPRRRR